MNESFSAAAVIAAVIADAEAKSISSEPLLPPPLRGYLGGPADAVPAWRECAPVPLPSLFHADGMMRESYT